MRLSGWSRNNLEWNEYKLFGDNRLRWPLVGYRIAELEYERLDDIVVRAE